ncbi:RagB/SusD family nutrient uptake outer membrane protein [Flavobacterium oncorhynchi]|uniref:RagB/SusD family nutrient uptake outer membrane protein n=1 Tax=Flavobacterium oncorhynchi TaxID=728056 RepID=UPI00351A8B59
MKTIHFKSIQILLCFLLLSTMISCESFVEVELPKSQLASENVFEDYNTASAALTEIYASIRDKGILTGGGLGISNQLGNYADEITSTTNPDNISFYFYSNALLPANSYVALYWNTAYNQIYAANSVLEGIQATKNLTQTQKNQLQGEALFIRALIHFYLVNIFGDVPYINQTDYKINSKVTRTPSDELHRLIIADLELSASLLSSSYLSADRVRPNALTVKALLARVYLYKKSYPEAANMASAVINQQTLFKLESITTAFLVTSKETIWQLQSANLGQNTAEAAYFIFTVSPPPLISLSNTLVNSFTAGDLRRSSWIKSVFNGSAVWYHAYKYKENTTTSVSKEYSIVFRLAEQYLIRAEARVMQGDLIGAKEDLNKIRYRANLNDTEAVTQQEIVDAVLQERQWELFTEYGHRFFDLKRLDKLDSTLKSVKSGWKTTDRLFPIPNTELSANPNLKPQNPGY